MRAQKRCTPVFHSTKFTLCFFSSPIVGQSQKELELVDLDSVIQIDYPAMATPSRPIQSCFQCKPTVVFYFPGIDHLPQVENAR
jgi:hypothetical protein